jgi:hypothetical protein
MDKWAKDIANKFEVWNDRQKVIYYKHNHMSQGSQVTMKSP